MQTLLTGLLWKNRVNGFTLVELLVVMLIVGLFSALISIRIEGSLSGGDLRLATRVIMGEINKLRGKAACTHKEHVLGLNVDENYLYSIQSIPQEGELSEKIKKLPSGVNLEDVVIFSEGKIQEGEAKIRFFANGCIDRSLIHLTNEKDEKYTLQINPITGQITVYDKYIDQKME